ncbi:MAG: NAD-dependent DNA ligase LigA, partial [Alistipes sp.]|nr:NAD-dependent DNA ligase LigA [Candidatus Minthomonas equi]
MSITRQKAKVRINELRAELEIHNRNYYVLNSPVITDFEYDLLMQELISLEKMFPEFSSAESPSLKVGSDLSPENKEFRQYAHRFPMLSLGNTYNTEELIGFDTRIVNLSSSSPEYNCELKFDGTAICLTYEKGRLTRALTRGDGVKGDDVTANVLTIDSIPENIGEVYFDFEIRGEIYMPYDAFDRLNAERAEQEEPPFANPRNAASGSLKLLNPLEVSKRGLKCVLYHMLGDNLPFSLHTEAIAWAASRGLPVSEHSKICRGRNEVFDYISQWDEKRKFLPFPTDGIVIKVNNLSLQNRLGFTSKTPRWATAFKFKPEEALTRVLSFDYQVGRPGAVTPVANLEPVQLSGTVVRRATLHNFEQMELLDIRQNDWVY